MPVRLVALDEGPDIRLDRAMVVVGRHPSCDTRLDSLRVSRHHCCMTQENGEVMVRDLGSANGIRINGQLVEIGRLRPGDELSIANLRYRVEEDDDDDNDGPGESPSPDQPVDDPLTRRMVSTLCNWPGTKRPPFPDMTGGQQGTFGPYTSLSG
jgi:predicted component of type VI protein secretion system